MALYLVSYDLIKPEKDYPDLINTLTGIGAKRVLYSEWMFSRSNTSTSKVFDYVRSNGKMDGNDKLLVVDVADWVSVNTMAEISKV
jgi:hypothetical protein